MLRKFGAVVQLVERLVRNEEVRDSNSLRSTTSRIWSPAQKVRELLFAPATLDIVDVKGCYPLLWGGLV